MENTRSGPLRSVRVIEISNVVAGPFFGSLCADMGADVIKIEMPGVGDPNRHFLPIVNGVGLRWATFARNKRLITLDLRTPEGAEILMQLIKEADMVVENFRPGTIEKWGIGYDRMKAVNPKIVLCRVSGYGQTGPYSSKVGFGTPASSFAGLTTIQGYADRMPVSPNTALGDFLAGTFALVGGLSSVISILKGDREEGQVVDVSLFEPQVRLLDDVISRYGMLGEIQERTPFPYSNAAPCSTYQARDGKWVTLVASTPKTWERLADQINPALKEDPRFITNSDRVKHDQEIMAIVADWVATMDSKALCALMDKEGVPCCPCNDAKDMYENEQYQAREAVIKVQHPELGEIPMVGQFPKFSDTPLEVRFPGRTQMGYDNEQVFKNELGLSDEKYSELKEKNII